MTETIPPFLRDRANSLSNALIVEECEELLLKATSITEGREKRLLEEARRYLSQCCSKLEDLIKPEYHSYWLLSCAYFERAKLEKRISASNHCTLTSSAVSSHVKLSQTPKNEHTTTSNENLLHTFMSILPQNSMHDESTHYFQKALEKIQQCCQLNEGHKSEDSYLLWASILLFLAQSAAQNRSSPSSLIESEHLLIKAAERLLKATQLPSNSTFHRTFHMLQRILELLVNGTKHRERTGVAVYQLAGELVKKDKKAQKSWNSRWFVLADSLCYYKDRKEWEHGAAKGNPVQAKKTLDLRDIMSAYSHYGEECSMNIPKKYENTMCLHIHTETRTFDLIGIESRELAEKWVESIAFAVKSANVKRSVKQWLKDNVNMMLMMSGSDSSICKTADGNEIPTNNLVRSDSLSSVESELNGDQWGTHDFLIELVQKRKQKVLQPSRSGERKALESPSSDIASTSHISG